MTDLRREAEERALSLSMDSGRSRNSTRYSGRLTKTRSGRFELSAFSVDSGDQPNTTPQDARIYEKDYILNSSRARAESDDFVPPRWVPDIAVDNCRSCNVDFDWVNRRHHCRNCGLVFCDACTHARLLMPAEFGYRDPMRVCKACADQLQPLQMYLSTNMANHQRVNTVDIASDNCNVRRYANMPYANTLGSEIRKAAYTIHNLMGGGHVIKDNSVPIGLIKNAKGLVFLTVFKAGFFLGGRFGTGLVISRLPPQQGGGWSAPSAISLFGLSYGFMIGADLTDLVIILNSTEAVEAFMGAGQITVGAGLEIAVGPVGRSSSAGVHLSDTALASAYSYSHSRGLCVGASLEGNMMFTRTEVNHRFYGRPVQGREILEGFIPRPRAAEPLYNALSEVMVALPAIHHRSPVISDISRSSILLMDRSQQQKLGEGESSAVDMEMETVRGSFS